MHKVREFKVQILLKTGVKLKKIKSKSSIKDQFALIQKQKLGWKRSWNQGIFLKLSKGENWIDF